MPPLSTPEPIPAGFESLPVFAPHDSISGATSGVLAPHGIRAFRHAKSGVRVVIFEAPGPLVSATMVVNTQPISNAGHPHTLEHIIFLGSHNHPRRGYLDNLACRCLADGTNAWTDNEYTAYTATTAGLDGLLLLLPVYLDHVLRPVINRAAFASEVYHVRADGKEAGVVFCEMQARENTEPDMGDRAIRATLLAKTPLSMESSGLCADIRTLSNEDIARFHRDQYCGANVTVVIGGSKIPAQSLLGSVQTLLDDFSSQPGFLPGKPQWLKPLKIAPLPPLTREVVNFPCPDESIGSITLSWRGPGALQKEEKIAVDIVLRYLANDVWSPLRQLFVEVEEQKASDIFYFQEPYFELSTFGFTFSGVEHREEDSDDEGDEDEDGEEEINDSGDTPKQAVDAETEECEDDAEEEKDSFLLSGKLQEDVMDFLKKIVDSGELYGGLEAIHTAIRKDRENHIAQFEYNVHEAVPYHLVEEIVYAHRGHLVIGEETRGSLMLYDTIREKDEDYWVNIIRKHLVESPRVDIITVPDAALAEKLSDDERNAVNERISKIGKEKLTKLGKENEKTIASLKPEKFSADDFPPIPSTMNISRWPYVVEREKFPGFISQTVTLETEFVHCTIMLDTSRLTLEQRMFVPILCNLISTCDILLEDGCYISYTDNARALSEASVTTEHSGVFLGYGNFMAHQCVIIHFAAQPDSFAEASELILQTMFQSEVTAERLSAVSQTVISGNTSELRDGSSVLAAVIALLPFVVGKPSTDVEPPNYVLSNLIGCHPLISFVSDEFTRNKPRKQLRRSILRRMHDSLGELRSLPSKDVFIQISGRDPKPARDIFNKIWTEKRQKFARKVSDDVVGVDKNKMPEMLPLSRRIYGTFADMFHGDNVGRIIGISGIESSFMEVGVDSPVYTGHADWSALSVVTEMLGRMEGPLCDAVRGTGLSYGISMSNASWLGRLVLNIEESSSPAAAWDAACEALQEFRKALSLGEKSELNVDLDTAKAATLFWLHRGRSTPESIGFGALTRAAISAPSSPLADQALEEAVEKVTLESIANVFDSHVARLFEAPKNRMVVVTCGKGVVKETMESFKKCKYPITVEECTIESLYPAEMQKFVKSLK